MKVNTKESKRFGIYSEDPIGESSFIVSEDTSFSFNRENLKDTL